MVYPPIFYTDLNGLMCEMKVTVERNATFDTAVLFARPAEAGQDRHRQPIDAEEELDSGLKRIIMTLTLGD